MEKDHNQEIVTSRIGGYGGSDAKLFYKIGTKGIHALNNTDKKRIAVAKGLIEYKHTAMNEAMQRGHDFEDWYEGTLKLKLSEREPKLSKQIANNFDTFFHADFFISESKIYELKCVSEPDKAAEHYKEQLQWQIMIFDLPVYLVICDSSKTFEDGTARPLYIKRDETIINAILKGIQLLDECYDTIDLTTGEEWTDGDLLFFEQKEVATLANYLNEIKQLEEQAKEHKERVLNLMLENNISSLKSDMYSITLVPEGTSNTFDKKKLLADHPEIIESDYLKTNVKKAYIKVTTK